MLRSLKIIFTLLLALTIGFSNGQSHKKKKKLGTFQRNRAAFQKARYGKTTKRYGKACQEFEKNRTRGSQKAIFHFGRKKTKTKRVAEQG